MDGSAFDEADFFATIQKSGARALLIGRQALVAYGIPVLTADYDLWIHIDDIEALNEALASLELFPNRPPSDARRTGRYVLEGDEHVDVLVARAKTTKDGRVVAFDEVWSRRERVDFGSGISIALPSIDDLIATTLDPSGKGSTGHSAARDAEGETGWRVNRQRLAEGAAKIWERELTPEEFDRRLASITDEERAANVELIEWFLCRYPTVRQRLQYARRKYAEAARPRVVVGGKCERRAPPAAVTALKVRAKFAGTSEAVFLSERGAGLRYPTVSSTFLVLVRSIGIHFGAGQRGPHIHDLRHTLETSER